MAGVKWTDQALDDLESVGEFIARDSPWHAKLFVQDIFESAQKLTQFPRSGREVPELGRNDVREIILRNYRVMYAFDGKDVHILAVYHSARLLPRDGIERRME